MYKERWEEDVNNLNLHGVPRSDGFMVLNCCLTWNRTGSVYKYSFFCPEDLHRFPLKCPVFFVLQDNRFSNTKDDSKSVKMERFSSEQSTFHCVNDGSAQLLCSVYWKITLNLFSRRIVTNTMCCLQFFFFQVN